MLKVICAVILTAMMGACNADEETKAVAPVDPLLERGVYISSGGSVELHFTPLGGNTSAFAYITHWSNHTTQQDHTITIEGDKNSMGYSIFRDRGASMCHIYYYDRATKTLYLGDGDTRGTEECPRLLKLSTGYTRVVE